MMPPIQTVVDGNEETSKGAGLRNWRKPPRATPLAHSAKDTITGT